MKYINQMFINKEKRPMYCRSQFPVAQWWFLLGHNFLWPQWDDDLVYINPPSTSDPLLSHFPSIFGNNGTKPWNYWLIPTDKAPECNISKTDSQMVFPGRTYDFPNASREQSKRIFQV